MKDPAFLFYPNDYIGGTMGMTFEEKGAYIEILMMQFNRGHMSGHMIGQTVGQLWVKIQDKFIKDSKGLWYNERLEFEQNRRKSFTDSRKNNLKGINQHTKNLGHTTSRMENENRNRNIDINNINIKGKKVFNFRKELLAFGFKENLVDDWLKVRKTKKATNTETAFRNFIIEIHKSNVDYNFILDKCVTNSWAGFKNDWLEKEKSSVKKEKTAYEVIQDIKHGR